MSSLAAWLCGSNVESRPDRFSDGPDDYTLSFGREPESPEVNVEDVAACWGTHEAVAASREAGPETGASVLRWHLISSRGSRSWGSGKAFTRRDLEERRDDEPSEVERPRAANERETSIRDLHGETP